MAPNTSATGGYLDPTTTQALPGNLTLTQFIQTVLVALSDLPGAFVRPKFQIEPPKQPDATVNWLAFAIVDSNPDTNASVSIDENGVTTLRRQREFEVQCSFYGPAALDIAELVADGFQLQQNVEALRAANMGYGYIDRARRVPDLVNERWIDRWEQTVYLRRQTKRVYPVLSILSASGTIHSFTGNEEYLANWQTPEEI